MRTKIAKGLVHKRREEVQKDMVQLLTSSGVQMKKHSGPSALKSKGHATEKTMAMTADLTSLEWSSGKAGRDVKVVELTAISTIACGFDASPVFQQSVGAAEDSGDPKKYCSLHVMVKGKVKEECLEFDSEWTRNRVIRCMHTRLVEMGKAPAPGSFCPALRY